MWRRWWRDGEERQMDWTAPAHWTQMLGKSEDAPTDLWHTERKREMARNAREKWREAWVDVKETKEGRKKRYKKQKTG